MKVNQPNPDAESLLGLLATHDELYEQQMKHKKNTVVYKELEVELSEIRKKYNDKCGREMFKI